MAQAKSAKTKVSLPLAVGKGNVPVSVEVTLTKVKPARAKNVAKIELGGEEFYVVAGKTVLE